MGTGDVNRLVERCPQVGTDREESEYSAVREACWADVKCRSHLPGGLKGLGTCSSIP